ncbi:MAG: sulfatase-like hydrolase/transferase, partial [Planctomycetota bacterium]
MIALCLALVCALPAQDAPTPPPNVVLIVTDDQGYADLGCYGATEFRTPRIDALADEG